MWRRLFSCRGARFDWRVGGLLLEPVRQEPGHPTDRVVVESQVVWRGRWRQPLHLRLSENRKSAPTD